MDLRASAASRALVGKRVLFDNLFLSMLITTTEARGVLSHATSKTWAAPYCIEREICVFLKHWQGTKHPSSCVFTFFCEK